MAQPRVYPYEDGDTIVIGPECFAAKDGSVLSWQGENYIPQAAIAQVCRERDEAILERDEMRKANITPEDADRPLGQSVEYWQERALDHATALDKAREELRIARFDADTARGELDMAVAAAAQSRCTDDGVPFHDYNCEACKDCNA